MMAGCYEAFGRFSRIVFWYNYNYCLSLSTRVVKTDPFPEIVCHSCTCSLIDFIHGNVGKDNPGAIHV